MYIYISGLEKRIYIYIPGKGTFLANPLVWRTPKLPIKAAFLKTPIQQCWMSKKGLFKFPHVGAVLGVPMGQRSFFRIRC